MNHSFNLIFVVLLWLFTCFACVLNQIKSETDSITEYDCSLIKESTLSSSKGSESILENSFFTSSRTELIKCGILPANLVNNQKSNSKFLIKWSFKTHKSIELEFRLDSVENYSLLNYYYSIRKFTGDEFYSGVKPFQPLPETIDTAMPISNNTDHKNTLILNIETISIEYKEEYDQLKNAFIICTIILNLKSGITFNLPFMCVDVFFDKFYYRKDKVCDVCIFHVFRDVTSIVVTRRQSYNLIDAIVYLN